MEKATYMAAVPSAGTYSEPSQIYLVPLHSQEDGPV